MKFPGGREIRERRIKAGLTIRECIEAGGPRHWSDVEAGRWVPTIPTLERIGRILKVDWRWLIVDRIQENEMKPKKFRVRVALGNETRSQWVVVEANNAPDARRIAEAQTGGVAKGLHQVTD